MSLFEILLSAFRRVHLPFPVSDKITAVKSLVMHFAKQDIN